MGLSPESSKGSQNHVQPAPLTVAGVFSQKLKDVAAMTGSGGGN